MLNTISIFIYYNNIIAKCDHESLSEAYLAEIGDEASKPLFVWPKDNTHLKTEGAVKMVSLLCEQLRLFGKPYSNLLYGEKAEENCLNDEVF